MEFNPRTTVGESTPLATTARAQTMVKEGHDVVILAAGEPDFNTPDNIKQAAIRAVENNYSHYTPASGLAELKDAIVTKFQRENNIKYSPNEVLVSVGGKQSLYNTFQLLVKQSDEVILPSPYWSSYVPHVKLAGGTPVPVFCKGLKVTSDQIESKITDKTKVLLINTPNNPTGMICEREELKKIADLAEKHNLVIVSDEVYEHFIYKGRHCSIASLNDDTRKRTLTVNSVSKTYAMTGYRIGYVAGDAATIKALSALQSHETSNPASIAQMAAVEALNGPQDSVQEMRAAFKERRDYIVSALNNIPKIECPEPEGAFYAFPDIRQTGMSSAEFAERLLTEAKVAVIPGAAFGSDRHIRISYAASLDDIKKGMQRLADWIKNI